MHPRARRTAGNLALLTISVLVALAALEAGVRLWLWLTPTSVTFAASESDAQRERRWHVYQRFQRERGGDGLAAFEASEYDPLLGWVPRTNLVDYVHPLLAGGRLPVSTNSEGMRGRREFARAKPPGVRRLVVLGDSFTFGIGEDDEHVWPARLAALLPGWEVLNLGVYGYGTDQQLLMLQERGMRWSPDVVVQALYVEDVYRNAMAFRDYAKPRFVLDGDRLRLTNVPVPSPDELLARQDPPLRLRSYALDLVRARLRATSPLDPSDAELDRLTRALFLETVRTSRAGGARFLLVVIPMHHVPKRSRRIEDLLAQWAAELDVPVLDVRDPLVEAERRTGTPMWALHFSRAGNEETARLVYEKLATLGWAP